MAEIETKLNDIRREHAKAVAAANSCERRVTREKELAEEMVKNIEREYSEKLEKCEKKLKNVEKERNLLMVRIREDKRNSLRCRPASGKL